MNNFYYDCFTKNVMAIVIQTNKITFQKPSVVTLSSFELFGEKNCIYISSLSAVLALK